jgi:hypothetical protein
LKQFMLSAVKVIAEKVIAIKAKNNGKLPYGFITKLWKEGKETFPKMSRKTINNYILKLGNKKPVTTLVVKQASNSSSSMSKITKDTCWDDSFVAVSKELQLEKQATIHMSLKLQMI